MSAAGAAGVQVHFGPNQRRWADLTLWRVCLGLVLAPAIPFGLMVVVGELLSHGFLLHDGEGAAFVLIFCLAALAWSLISGLGYQFAVVRLRGRTGRIECFMLGVAAAFSLPAAITVVNALFPDFTFMGLHPGAPDPLIESLQDSILIGLGLSPFGLFGGWIFWRIGIRPAPRPVPDVAAVFE